MKEFKTSVDIWQSYGPKYNVLFFDSRCTFGVESFFLCHPQSNERLVELSSVS